MRLKYLLSTLFIGLFVSLFSTIQADPGDTLVVQTYTFEEQNNPNANYDSPGRRWFTFPEDDGTTYQKILMYYTLKCFEDGTAGGLGFPCGEWDYLTYNYLFDHTGMLDSNLLDHPQFLFNNTDFEEVQYIETPLFNTIQYSFDAIESVEVMNEMEYEIASDGSTYDNVLRTDAKRSRYQFFYTSEELDALGMTAGEIGQMELALNGNFSASDIVRIEMGAYNGNDLESFYGGALQEVYAGAFMPSENGFYSFPFSSTFEWNGSSGILIQLSTHTNTPIGITTVDSETTTTHSVAAWGNDRYVAFNNTDELKVPGEAFDTVADEITIAFWINGDGDIQPSNSTIFEGVNAENQRVVNSHLPWGNGRVYWDCGQDGTGYDRIDDQAGNADYSDKWNHWAFVKDAVAGEMQIYLNGSLWHSGADRYRGIEDIVKFSIGSAAGWSNFYNGRLDEFAVWNKALDGATISEWMSKTLTDDHPNTDDLVVYYNFNEENGQPVSDLSGNGFDAVPHGAPDRQLHVANELFLDPAVELQRPAVKMHQGEYTITTTETTYEEQIQVAPTALSEWEVDGYEVVLSSIDYYWEPQDTYVLDEEGNIIATLPYEGQIESLVNDTLEYWGAPFEVVDRYEIGRFITPYGIGLDLDEDGWTWVFDVTDYEPLLHGEVELEAGNWQELLDMKFLFIEGTPPRDVQRVEAFWKGTYNLNNFDEMVTDHEIEVQDGEEQFRLKTRASGHGFGSGNNCGEFCFNTHSVQVNGQTQWSWEIMQECADNPLYPQGGTWIYDRAGWCPGDKVTTQNFEITDLVSGSETFTVDYDIDYDPDGNYRFEGQVITYGAPNFATDVELVEILAPSKWKIRSRMNPICDDPIIQIRNNGTETLTSVTITYGVGGVNNSYTWTGELGFLETADVQLSYDNPNFWSGDEEEEQTFEVTLSNPNGGADENEFNNYGSSKFLRPTLYTYGDDDDNRIIIWTKTNNAPWETSVRLETMNGTTVYFRDDFTEANENYRDTIALNEGCYKLTLADSDEDGLSFFANNDGNGTFRLKKVAGSTFETFENDFGKEIVHYFRFETDLVSVEEIAKVPEFKVYPNPGNEYFYVSMNGEAGRYPWMLYDINGKQVANGLEQLSTDGRFLVNTGNLAPGVYNLIIEVDGIPVSRRWIK